MQQQRIEGYLERLFAYAYSLAQDAEQARDLVQDCALRALDSRRVPADQAAYRAWLFRILRNRFIDSRRKRGEVLLDDADAPADEAPALRWDGDARVIDVLTVRLGLKKLSPAHREVIALVDLAGLTYKEAAETLAVAPGTVMSRLARARRALLQVIAEDNVTPLSAARRRQRR